MIYDFFSSFGSVGRLQDYIVLVESFTLHGLENVTEPLSTYKWVNHSFIPLARTEQKKKSNIIGQNLLCVLFILPV